MEGKWTARVVSRVEGRLGRAVREEGVGVEWVYGVGLDPSGFRWGREGS